MKLNQPVKIKSTGQTGVVKYVIKQNGRVIYVRVYLHSTNTIEKFDINQVELCG